MATQSPKKVPPILLMLANCTFTPLVTKKMARLQYLSVREWKLYLCFVEKNSIINNSVLGPRPSFSLSSMKDNFPHPPSRLTLKRQ